MRSRAARGSAAALLAASGLIAACTASSPHTLDGPGDRSRALARGDRIRTWPQAISSVSEVLRSRLGFLPFEFSVSFYSSRAAFERGLVEAGYSREVARRVATTLDGVGIGGRVLLNEKNVARASWPGRLSTLAHELVHVLQYDLAGGKRGGSEQWLREGFAEWVGGRTLEELHLGKAGATRRRALRAVDLAGGPSRFPSLSEMATWNDWIGLRETRPALPIYSWALLAADALVERHGVEAVLGYFRLFAASDEPAAHFRTAFGESREAFEAAFTARLARDGSTRFGVRREIVYCCKQYTISRLTPRPLTTRPQRAPGSSAG